MKNIFFALVLLVSCLAFGQEFRFGTASGADDQIITDFSLTGNILSITLENGNTQTVDLSTILGVDNSLSETDQTIASGTRTVKTGVTAITQFTNGSNNVYFSLSGGSIRPYFENGLQIAVSPTQEDDAVRKIDLDNAIASVATPTTDYLTHTTDISVTSTHISSGLAKVINRSVTDTINYTLEDADLVKNDKFIFQALGKPSIVTIPADTENSIFLGSNGDTGTRVTAPNGDAGMLERINTSDSIQVYCQICSIDSPIVLGAELIGNGTFDDNSWWTTILTEEGPNSVSGGTFRLLSTDTGNSYLVKDPMTGLSASNQYRLEYDVVSYTLGALTTEGGAGNIPSTVGHHVVDFTADGSRFVIKRTTGNVDITIDNVSVKQIL